MAMTLIQSTFNVANQLGRVDPTGTEILDLENPIKDEIRNAIRHYSRQASYLTELRGGILRTEAGVYWYDTVSVADAAGFQNPSDRPDGTTLSVEDILNLHYMRENPGLSGLNEPLDEISYEQFERLFEGSVPQGQPELYCHYAGQIGIWPTPAAAQDLYWSGIVRPPVPINDNDDSVWLREQRELIENAAAARLCAKYLRDTERAVTFKALESEQYDNFRNEYVLQSSSRRLKLHM